MDTTSHVTISQHKDVSIVELKDSKILDEMNISEIGQTLTALVGSKDRPKLLLDFTNVEYLSSGALGMLINVNERIKQRNGQLRLASIRPQIKEVFDITKLNRLFRLCDGRQSALESFE
jgi:anti-sigma B factor antagonist